jgi:hypothetical protein
LHRDEDTQYIWKRTSDREGASAYSINRDLPQIQMIYSKLDQPAQNTFEMLLQTIEQNFPAGSIYLDVASGELSQIPEDISKMKSDIELHLEKASDIGLSKQELLAILLNTEPYSKSEELRALFPESK